MVPVLGERAQRDLLELEKVCSRIYRPRVSNTQGHAGCALLLFHQHDPFKHSSTFLLISLHPVGFCKIGPTHRMSHFKCYRKEKKELFGGPFHTATYHKSNTAPRLHLARAMWVSSTTPAACFGCSVFFGKRPHCSVGALPRRPLSPTVIIKRFFKTLTPKLLSRVL